MIKKNVNILFEYLIEYFDYMIRKVGGDVPLVVKDLPETTMDQMFMKLVTIQNEDDKIQLLSKIMPEFDIMMSVEKLDNYDNISSDEKEDLDIVFTGKSWRMVKQVDDKIYSKSIKDAFYLDKDATA